MLLQATALAALLLPSLTSAHMMMSHPSVWGYQSSDLENPLNSGTYNWFCGGKSPSAAKGVATLTAGGTFTVPVICGEAAYNPGNAPNLCKADPNANHGGGGCGLSISYNTNPKRVADFTLFSVAHNCPNKGQPVSFSIPKNLPNGEGVCTWTWIPNPNNSANEVYMNCFRCKVVNGVVGSLTGGPKTLWWAVPGAPTYGNRPQYNKNYPNGAQPISVNGKIVAPIKAVTPAVTPAPTKYTAPAPGDRPLWDFCNSSKLCKSACCSKKWSDDGKYKCHPWEVCWA